MTSWGREDDAARADGDGSPGATDVGGGDGTVTSAGDAPPVITPDEIVPPGPRTAPVGLGLWDEPVPGDDPLPSTGSLKWAPDPTEPMTPDPTVAASGPGAPGGSPGVAAQTVTPGSPVLAAYRDRARAHVRRGPAPSRPAGDGPRRRWRTDPLGLAAAGVFVVIVVMAAILVTGDGGGPVDPAQSATTSVPPVAGDGAEPAGPIVGPTGVIGSWSGSRWQPRPDGEQPGAGLDYAVVGLADRFGTARGEAVAEDCPDQRSTSSMDVGVDLDAGNGGGPPPIAVAGVAEPQPRPVEPFGTDSGVYRQAAAEVAAGLGATTPPTLTQVVRTDLDGGGTHEIVVAAEHVSAGAGRSPAPGDWSVVFMRRVVGNGVATDVLASSVVGRGGGLGGGDRFDRIQISALADLNGDGAMEVALVGRSDAGEWTSIHALDDDGVPSEVLRAGCDD